LVRIFVVATTTSKLETTYRVSAGTRPKADCYTPIVSLPVVPFLTALAVQHKRTLKQGDFKNASVQAPLPERECTVIRSPPGCFHSGRGGFWRLKNLYTVYIALIIIGTSWSLLYLPLLNLA